MYESTANKREWLHVLDHCTAIELVLDASVSLAWFLKESAERAAYAGAVSEVAADGGISSTLATQRSPAKYCHFMSGLRSGSSVQGEILER